MKKIQNNAGKKAPHVIEIEIIDKIVKTITSNLDFEVTGQKIVDIMIDYLGSIGGILLIKNSKEKYFYAHSTSNTALIRKILKLLPKSFQQHKYYYKKKTSNLIIRTALEKKVFQNSMYEKFISPEVPYTLARLIQHIANIKTAISLPCIINNEVMAVLCISFNKKNISEQTMTILSIFADYVAIAVNNMLKYKQLKENFELEKETTSLLAHELKTPIAIAFNNTQILEELIEKSENKIEENIFNELKTINVENIEAIKRLNQICNSIFMLREIESYETDTVHELQNESSLNQIINNFQRQAIAKGLNFSYSLNLQKGKFYGGGVQFEQIVTILLDNALKYTKKGEITIKIENTTKILRCIITDTGIGIPKNKREAVFQRFYRHRTKENRNLMHIKGLGIGLYVGKKICDYLGGAIKIENNRNKKGTKFIAEIPIYSGIPKKIKSSI